MPNRITALLDERKRLERELSDAKKKLAMGGGDASASGDDGVEDVAGVKVMARALTGVDAKDLRSLVDEAKKKLGSGIVILVANDPEREGGARRRRHRRPDGAQTTRYKWCRPASPSWAAKAAAGGLTWRKAAAPMAARRRRRSLQLKS